MTSIGARPVRPTLRWPALVAALSLVLAAPGCDDLIEVDPEDQRIAVGSTSTTVCPDAMSNDGSANVIATVFATDGVRVSGVDVTFATSRGSLSADKVTSDERGLAQVQVMGSRTPDLEPIVVTGIHPSGEMNSQSIAWPLAPRMCLAAAPFTDPMAGNPPGCFGSGNTLITEVGQQFDVVTSVILPCNISRLTLSLEYDDAYVQFDAARKGGTLEIAPDGGTEQTTVLNASSVPGRIDVDYFQTAPPVPLGTNVPADPYLVLTFTAIAATPEVEGVNQGAGFAVADHSLSDDDGLVYPPSGIELLPPLVLVVEPVMTP